MLAKAGKLNEKTVRLVNLISEVGPDVAEISKRIGQYKESVRYTYKEKILAKGITVKANVDHEALGLRRIVMKARVAPEYEKLAQGIFSAMSDLCYLVACAGTMPEDSYILQAEVPVEFTNEYCEFMQALKEKGIFESIEFFSFKWFRVIPMRAEYFDFERGTWDFDWGSPLPLDAKAASAAVSEKKKFDRVDLLLVKEMWKDGTRSLKEIQDAIRKVNGIEVNYKTLGWHLANHVLQRGLIRGYSVGWHRARYDFELKKTRVRQHGYVAVALLVQGISEYERMTLMAGLNRLPFLWSQAAGRDFYSQFAFPLDTANEAFEYLKAQLKPFGPRAEAFLLNQKEMLSFCIGHMLWDDAKGRWTFEKEALLRRFDSLILKGREMQISSR